MTNKEAIDVLKSKFEDLLKGEFMTLFNRRGSDFDLAPAEDGKAIDLAIKALEREERCENQVAQSFLCSACGCYGEYNDEYPIEYKYCPNCGRKVEKKRYDETHIVNDYEPPKVNDYEPTKVNDFEPIKGEAK